MAGPTFVPVSQEGDMEVSKYNPILDESTDLESEESSRNGTANSSRAEPEESGFDFATLACCGFGSTRGTCALCHQPIGMSEAFYMLQGPDANGEGQVLVHMGCFQNQQRMKAYNATKIQALARGRAAREELRREATAREAAARRAFEMEREAQKAAELAALEAAEQAPKKKKSFVKRLFGGCFGSKSAVQEDDYSNPAVGDDDSHWTRLEQLMDCNESSSWYSCVQVETRFVKIK